MENDFKEAIEKSTKAIGNLEEKVEEIAKDLNDSASSLWADFQKNLTQINQKLEDSYADWGKESDEARLQASLGAMEARDKMEEMKDSMEEFVDKISKNAESALDTVALKAELAKKEAEELWNEKAPQITKEFNESKEKVSQVALEAVDEIGDFFNKIVSEFSNKK